MRRRASVLRGAHEQRSTNMPLRKYFLFVGVTLIMMLFAANWLLSGPEYDDRANSSFNLPQIRIHSELKGPAAVIINTSRPAVAQAPAEPEDIGRP